MREGLCVRCFQEHLREEDKKKNKNKFEFQEGTCKICKKTKTPIFDLPVSLVEKLKPLKAMYDQTQLDLNYLLMRKKGK